MSEDKLLYSKSETIGIPEERQLIELGRTLNRALTRNEFVAIAMIYNGVIDRLLKENEEENDESNNS